MRFHKTIEIVGNKIEDLKKIGMTPIEWAGSVPTFEFGDIFNIGKKTGNELLDYAKDLGANKMFHLPFPKTIATFLIPVNAHITVMAEERDDRFYIGMIGTTKDTFSGALQIDFRMTEDRRLDFGRGLSAVSALVNEATQKDVIHTLKELVPIYFIGLMAMLNAKGIEQRITPPPVKLNKRRVAAGKPPIGELREVLINVDGKRYMPSGEAEKGSHASPRLHWRRGHIRRLPSGEITHVRPHLVGSGTLAPTPTYRVKQHA